MTGVRALGAGAVTILFLTGVLVACGSDGTRLPPQTPPAPRARVQGGRPAHLAVIVMENEEYGSVIGSHSTPFINRLAPTFLAATVPPLPRGAPATE